MDTVTVAISVFIFGVIIGSFLNVLIYRIPRGENIAYPPSKCTRCGTELKFYHNIPVISWLALKGKCAFCSQPVSSRYPLVEMLSGIVFATLYLKLGLVWYLPFVWGAFALLIALVMIDFEYMAVPDNLNFAALAFSLVQPDFIDALMNAAIAGGGLYLIGLLSSLLARKQAMGGADVIVAATMGALLGFPNFFVAIFLSALLAMIPSLLKRETGVPFVPFLALATFIVYLFDAQSAQLIEKLVYG